MPRKLLKTRKRPYFIISIFRGEIILVKKAEAENNELKNTMIKLLNQKIEDGKNEAKEAEAAKPKEEHKDHKHAPIMLPCLKNARPNLVRSSTKWMQTTKSKNDGSLTRAEICLAAMDDEIESE